MNKMERMEAVLRGGTPDCTPAGFWFHYPADWTTRQKVEGHVKLLRDIDADVVKVMDDSFGHMATQGMKIERASDWRKLRLPGRECDQYRNMVDLIRGVLDETHGEAPVLPTMWSPFKLASFTYVFGGGSDEQFMAHCKEDPESVLAGVDALAEMLADWANGYIEAGAHGVYYSGQFSEPQRFTDEQWERLVKPSDLKVLDAVKKTGKYAVLHICGEREFGFMSTPARYRDYPADLVNWDVHRSGLSLADGRAVFEKPILGGMDNHGALVEGTCEEIAREAQAVCRGMEGQAFMLGADCTVPSDIDVSRLRAAVETAHGASTAQAQKY